MEIQRLGGVVEELRELVLRGVCAGERKGLEQNEHEDEMHDCDKPGCWCRPSGSGSGSGTEFGGRKIGKKHECGASNVANMRERDVYGDGEWDSEERRMGTENGKGFWDWVGGGILWRQD